MSRRRLRPPKIARGTPVDTPVMRHLQAEVRHATGVLLEHMWTTAPVEYGLRIGAMVVLFRDPDGNLGAVPTMAGNDRTLYPEFARVLRVLADDIEAGRVYSRAPGGFDEPSERSN